MSYELTLRHQRAISRSEITHVDISATAALAIYPTPLQPTQSWVDTFSLPTGNSPSASPSRLSSGVASRDDVNTKCLSKTNGSIAAFSPTLPSLVATLRPWTVTLGGGVEYHHSSTILIRDPTSGKTLLEIKDADASPITWSTDGQWVAAREGSSGERMGVWDARSGARVGRVLGHIDTVTHAKFTSSGLLVTASKDGTLRMTNPSAGRTAARLEFDSANPRALGVSPDGQTIVSIWGNTLSIWIPALNDLTSWNLNAKRANEGWPMCISPDCRFLACRTEDGFDVMDIKTGEVIAEQRSESVVTAAAFSTDGQVLLLGRMDGTIQIWGLEERRKR